MTLNYSPISVVIIGLNVEMYINECIFSVMNADYPSGLIEIIYVDGGSKDSSSLIAKAFGNVKVIELKDRNPTPGKGRNAGYKAASHQVIQFIDADTIIDPGWFKNALPNLEDNKAAVKGKVIERYPQKNVYHLIGDIEWNISAGKAGWKFSDGPVKTFGGIVLIRKDVLEAVNGYDERLIAGEDPDISYRIRVAGWNIYQINKDMATHDLNMNDFFKYIKRSFRSGHAYAEIGFRYVRRTEKYFMQQLLRILFGVIFPLAVIFLGVVSDMSIIGLVFAIPFLFRPLIKILFLRKRYKLNFNHALLYGVHLSFVIYPQFFGVLRYLFARVFGIPLKNKGYAQPT
jgi:glycosyltransferase involved in cell wall biosynthesis